MVDLKEKLIKLNEESRLMPLGEIPENEIEEDIFTELMLFDANVYPLVKRFEKTGEIDWTLENIDTSKLKELVNSRGISNFKENAILFKKYTNSLELAEVMKKIKEEIDKQNEN